MKAVRIGAAMAAMVMLCPETGHAEELWNAYPLRGFWEGLPAGATPPKGVYTAVSAYWANDRYYGEQGKAVPGTDLTAFVVTPVIEWVPGVKILGGTYSVGIAQPFVYNTSPGLSGSTGRGNWGTFNTVLLPAQLGWKLHNVHVKLGVGVYLPNASSTVSDLYMGKLHNGGLPSGSNFAAVEPDLGITWMHKGWNVSAALHAAIPVSASTAPGYRYWSGSEFAADYTITKTLGKWTLGVGGHQINQYEDDRFNGEVVPDHRSQLYGVGPIAGVQAGPLNITAMWNRTVSARNAVAGDMVQVRFTTRL